MIFKEKKESGKEQMYTQKCVSAVYLPAYKYSTYIFFLAQVKVSSARTYSYLSLFRTKMLLQVNMAN